MVTYEFVRLVNAFAYWQGQDISNATATYLDDLQLAIGHVQALSGSTTKIEIWNGETGWPGNGIESKTCREEGMANILQAVRTTDPQRPAPPTLPNFSRMEFVPPSTGATMCSTLRLSMSHGSPLAWGLTATLATRPTGELMTKTGT